MSFELRIEISGLCLFVVGKSGNEVRVLMPDARRQRNQETMTHWDGTEAIPHAGYVRFDLGNLLPNIPAAPNNSAGPRNEVVHRFDREKLDLGLSAVPGIEVGELEFPDFGKIDNSLGVSGDMYGNSPPKTLLMWMSLTGGRFIAHSAGSNWTFPNVSGADPEEPYQGQFANFVTWTRVVDAPGLPVTITPFGPGKPISVTLQPQNGIIRLKVGNLCAENPLEWPDLKIRAIGAEEDKDFRWLYRLVVDPNAVTAGVGSHIPFGSDGKLPVPILDRTSGAAGEEQDCTGGKIDGHF